MFFSWFNLVEKYDLVCSLGFMSRCFMFFRIDSSGVCNGVNMFIMYSTGKYLPLESLDSLLLARLIPVYNSNKKGCLAKANPLGDPKMLVFFFWTGT